MLNYPWNLSPISTASLVDNLKNMSQIYTFSCLSATSILVQATTIYFSYIKASHPQPSTHTSYCSQWPKNAGRVMFLTCIHYFNNFAFRIETKIHDLGLQSSLWSATPYLPRHKVFHSSPHFKCLSKVEHFWVFLTQDLYVCHFLWKDFSLTN